MTPRTYDQESVYTACEESDCRPVIKLRKTGKVRQGLHKPPRCEHGEWAFHGADAKNLRSKWRCPTGGCKPASTWLAADRLHTLVPRSTARWATLYKKRSAVERAFGRLKNDSGLTPLRVRGLDRVKLHADLTILAKLSCALARARVVPLAA